MNYNNSYDKKIKSFSDIPFLDFPNNNYDQSLCLSPTISNQIKYYQSPTPQEINSTLNQMYTEYNDFIYLQKNEPNQLGN